MKVIGAGLPRTGTLTQKLALEQLGVGPCYHWVDVLADLDREVGLWNRALDGGAPWAEVFDGYDSTVDWPGGYFYGELIEAYPEAKVLLSVREGRAWEPSFRETIWAMCFGESLMPLLSRARAEVDPRWRRYLALVDRMFWGAQGTFAAGRSPERLIEQMEAHNERVRRTVPAERLLVWEVTEGWEPLCEFLQVEVPAEPLPHANDRGTFLERVSDGAIGALQQWRDSRAPAA
jgi:Sulfotransferase domain